MLLEPEQRLIMAIVGQALQDLTSNNEKIKEEAKQWLFEDQEDFPFLMSILNMNPEKFRQAIKVFTYI